MYQFHNVFLFRQSSSTGACKYEIYENKSTPNIQRSFFTGCVFECVKQLTFFHC